MIAKKTLLEFNSLLHQFGADVVGSLHGTTVKKILQAVNPEAIKERFPKRGEPLSAPNPPPPAAGKEGRRAAEAAQTAAEEHRPAGPQAAARPAGKTPLPPPGAGPKRAGEGPPKTGPKPFVVKPNVGKPITIKPQASPPAPEAKPAAAKPTCERRPSTAIRWANHALAAVQAAAGTWLVNTTAKVLSSVPPAARPAAQSRPQSVVPMRSIRRNENSMKTASGTSP